MSDSLGNDEDRGRLGEFYTVYENRVEEVGTTTS